LGFAPVCQFFLFEKGKKLLLLFVNIALAFVEAPSCGGHAFGKILGGAGGLLGLEAGLFFFSEGDGDLFF
jgi:hypothetical protein